MLSKNVKYFKEIPRLSNFSKHFHSYCKHGVQKGDKNNNCTIPDILRYVQAKLRLTRICTSLNTPVIIVDNGNVEQA